MSAATPVCLCWVCSRGLICLAGGVDPITYLGDSMYSQKCVRVLSHILEEHWDAHVALQQLVLLIFADPPKPLAPANEGEGENCSGATPFLPLVPP